MFQKTAMIGEGQKRTLRYRDTWEGKNYGCLPVHTPGQQLKEKLDRSDQWQIVEKSDRIDERNDNQVDIHRGSDFVYLHADEEKRIYVNMNRSRSGKTIDWAFFFDFDEPVEF